MLLIFLPQEGLLLVVGGFNRMCQVEKKYRAVTPNEFEFYNSIRHLGFIHVVKQFLQRVYIPNLTKQNTKGRSIKVCEVLERCFSCLELNKAPNR